MQLKLINNKYYNFDPNSEELKNHFHDPHNFTKEILYQFNSLDYYREFISEKDKVILDLGSNIGLFAIHASPWADKVIGFEPTPSHFKLNQEMTSSFNNIEIHQQAVAAETGKTTFYTCKDNSTMNSLVDRGQDKFEVETKSIKDILDSITELHGRVHFIKMDIEGSEIYALTTEAIESLKEKADKILIEFHSTEDYSCEQNRDRFKLEFEKRGFNTKSFNTDGLFCFQ